MDKYQEAVFDFATKDENFEFTFEIGDHFELFKRKLINGFWDEVVHKLNEKATEINGWIPRRENEVIKGDTTIAGIYNKDYSCDKYNNSVNISFCNYGDGRILYGICFNWDVPGISYNKILSSAKKVLGKEWLVAPESWSYPIYKMTDENFKKYQSLKKILPSQKESLAEEFSDKIITTYKELSFLIEKNGIKF